MTPREAQTSKPGRIRVRAEGHPAAPAQSEPGRDAEGPPRVLLVSADRSWTDRTGRELAAAGIHGRAVRSIASAARRLGEESFGVVMLDLELSDRSPSLLAGLSDDARRAGSSLIAVPGRGDAGGRDAVVQAVRAGAEDFVARSPEDGELVRRVRTAGRRAEAERRQRERIVKLKRLCRHLNNARARVARQVEALSVDLLQAYQELADMNQVTTTTEFTGLIRNELDIESLLRTTLEYVLARTGPTNAAIFLPTTSGDYSLGAYVNYDCPKDTVDILLDHMANVIAPRFENLEGLLHLPEQKGLDRYIGDDAQWLEGSGVAAMACRHKGETLAVFMLFRDRRSPFTAPLLEQVKTIGELFASQLARVIHIHHRHLPKDKWGMLGDPERGSDDGYGDLAA